jgi:hypothetical protein
MHFDIHLGLAGIGGTSSDVLFQAKASFNFKEKQEERLRRRTFVLLTIFYRQCIKPGFAVYGSSQPIASKTRSPVRMPGMDLASR